MKFSPANIFKGRKGFLDGGREYFGSGGGSGELESLVSVPKGSSKSSSITIKGNPLFSGERCLLDVDLGFISRFSILNEDDISLYVVLSLFL